MANNEAYSISDIIATGSGVFSLFSIIIMALVKFAIARIEKTYYDDRAHRDEEIKIHSDQIKHLYSRVNSHGTVLPVHGENIKNLKDDIIEIKENCKENRGVHK